MFIPTKSRLLTAAILTLGLAASTASAQDLDAVITRDPSAGTVTYEFHASGPADGSVAIYASYGTLPLPLLLPGMGYLYLDPRFLVPVTSIRLDATGRGVVRIPVPMTLVNGDNHYFQGLFNDRGTLRLSGWCATLYHDVSGFNGGLTTILMHNPKTQVYRGEFQGRPGDHVEIVHYCGGQIDIWQGIIQPNGKVAVKFAYKNKQKHGDKMEIRLNGNVVKSWSR